MRVRVPAHFEHCVFVLVIDDDAAVGTAIVGLILFMYMIWFEVTNFFFVLLSIFYLQAILIVAAIAFASWQP